MEDRTQTNLLAKRVEEKGFVRSYETESTRLWIMGGLSDSLWRIGAGSEGTPETPERSCTATVGLMGLGGWPVKP